MSVDTTLDTSLALIVSKARSGLGVGTTPSSGGSTGGGTTTTAPVRPATVNFEWAGGGTQLTQTAADPILIEIPFPCTIVWAHLRAGDAAGNPSSVTATVDVELSQFETFGGKTPLYGTGTTPTLSSQSKNNVSLTGWKIDLTTGDTIIARLTALSGSATWLTLTLLLRPTDVPITTSNIADSSGNLLIDSGGNTLILQGPR